jgi:hypothetical protein
MAFEVAPDPQAMTALLERVKIMLKGLEAGILPEDYLPPEHWAHRYCPYLEICDPGKKALEWQAQQPKALPDKVVADMIAKRIVAKKGARMQAVLVRSWLVAGLDWE